MVWCGVYAIIASIPQARLHLCSEFVNMSSRRALRYRYRVRCYDCPTPLRNYHSPLFWYLWEADQWLEEFPVGHGVFQFPNCKEMADAKHYCRTIVAAASGKARIGVMMTTLGKRIDKPSFAGARQLWPCKSLRASNVLVHLVVCSRSLPKGGEKAWRLRVRMVAARLPRPQWSSCCSTKMPWPAHWLSHMATTTGLRRRARVASASSMLMGAEAFTPMGSRGTHTSGQPRHPSRFLFSSGQPRHSHQWAAEAFTPMGSRGIHTSGQPRHPILASSVQTMHSHECAASAFTPMGSRGTHTSGQPRHPFPFYQGGKPYGFGSRAGTTERAPVASFAQAQTQLFSTANNAKTR